MLRLRRADRVLDEVRSVLGSALVKIPRRLSEDVSPQIRSEYEKAHDDAVKAFKAWSAALSRLGVVAKKAGFVAVYDLTHGMLRNMEFPFDELPADLPMEGKRP